MNHKRSRIAWAAWSVWMVSLGFMGCRAKDGATDRTGEARRAKPAAAAQKVANSDQALVQVIFYGLMAFDYDRDATGKPTNVWALFPFTPSGADEHHPAYHYGYTTGTGALAWKRSTRTLKGTIQIAFDPDPGIPLTVPVRAHAIDPAPDNPDEARDSRWILEAHEITGKNEKADRKQALLKVVASSGEFETCGLVHDGSLSNVCEVTAGRATRAASEYMVLRWVVPKITKVYVVIDGNKSAALAPTGDDAGQGYAAVYDIALTNLPDELDHREPETDHLEHLRDEFFSAAPPPWAPFTYSNVCSPQQAECIQRYDGWDGSPSGYDRPLCPFIKSDS